MVGARFHGGGVRHLLVRGVLKLQGAVAQVAAAGLCEVPLGRGVVFTCCAAALVEVGDGVGLWHGRNVGRLCRGGN